MEITNEHNRLALAAIVTGAGVVKTSVGTGAYEQLVNAVSHSKLTIRKTD